MVGQTVRVAIPSCGYTVTGQFQGFEGELVVLSDVRVLGLSGQRILFVPIGSIGWMSPEPESQNG
jgi:hypothetical protein